MFFEQKNTPYIYGGFRIFGAKSPLLLCLSGGDQLMLQGIIRNSLGDASRHHQGVKGLTVCNKHVRVAMKNIYRWKIVKY